MYTIEHYSRYEKDIILPTSGLIYNWLLCNFHAFTFMFTLITNIFSIIQINVTEELALLCQMPDERFQLNSDLSYAIPGCNFYGSISGDNHVLNFSSSAKFNFTGVRMYNASLIVQDSFALLIENSSFTNTNFSFHSTDTGISSMSNCHFSSCVISNEQQLSYLINESFNNSFEFCTFKTQFQLINNSFSDTLTNVDFVIALAPNDQVVSGFVQVANRLTVSNYYINCSLRQNQSQIQQIQMSCFGHKLQNSLIIQGKSFINFENLSQRNTNQYNISGLVAQAENVTITNADISTVGVVSFQYFSATPHKSYANIASAIAYGERCVILNCSLAHSVSYSHSHRNSAVNIGGFAADLRQSRIDYISVFDNSSLDMNYTSVSYAGVLASGLNINATNIVVNQLLVSLSMSQNKSSNHYYISPVFGSYLGSALGVHSQFSVVVYHSSGLNDFSNTFQFGGIAANADGKFTYVFSTGNCHLNLENRQPSTQTFTLTAGGLFGEINSSSFGQFLGNITVQVYGITTVKLGLLAGSAFNISHSGVFNSNLTATNNHISWLQVGQLVGELTGYLMCINSNRNKMAIYNSENNSQFITIGLIVGYSNGGKAENIMIEGEISCQSCSEKHAGFLAGGLSASTSFQSIVINATYKNQKTLRLTGMRQGFTFVSVENIQILCEETNNIDFNRYCMSKEQMQSDLFMNLGQLSAEVWVFNALINNGIPFIRDAFMYEMNNIDFIDGSQIDSQHYFIDNQVLLPRLAFEPCRGNCSGQYTSFWNVSCSNVSLVNSVTFCQFVGLICGENELIANESCVSAFVCSEEYCGSRGRCSIANNAVACSCYSNVANPDCSECSPGFFDVLCDLDQKQCNLQYCSDHGECSADLSCSCAPNYSGSICNQCRAQQLNYSDSCASCNNGFVGVDCEWEAAQCDAEFCGGHGVCSVSGELYCECTELYTGRQCNHCKNGGQPDYLCYVDNNMSNGDIAVIVVCSVISPILVGGLVVWLVLWLKKRDIGSVEENVPLTDEA